VAKLAAWFRACGCGESLVTEVRAELLAAGIRLTPFESANEPSHYGIVCFDRISDEVFSLLHLARHKSSGILALVLPAAGTVPPVWRLLSAGATDALIWDGAGVATKQISAKLKRWSDIDETVDEASSQGFFIGGSSAWRELVRKVVEAARFTSSPILLTGESGTGKEVLARLVSKVTCALEDGRTPRRELVTVDCGALTPELSGSEFFGHERGAYTGAHSMRDGAFALANGATLLLDEIGEIPLSIQTQLLRSIQEKSYKRLGGTTWQRTHFRLVCATNRDLEDLVRRGQFRLDLYHRIAGCVFCTPPLRDRREDILPLASHFLGNILPNGPPKFDTHVGEYLVNRSYAGNVRELRQLIERIAIRYPGTGPITAGDVPEEDRPARGEVESAWPDENFEQSITKAVTLGSNLKEIGRTATQHAIRIAVDLEQGNLHRAARRLGITDRALQMRRAAGQLAPGAGDAAGGEDIAIGRQASSERQIAPGWAIPSNRATILTPSPIRSPSLSSTTSPR
jgi:transcriptional regulator with GAF, ATPase, and Fis domain